MTVDGATYPTEVATVGPGPGVAMVPEERRSQGLFLLESIAFNASLSTLRNYRRRFLPVLDVKAINSVAGAEICRYGIKARSAGQSVVELSGGNQQKVVVSRLVQTGPKLIVFDEPTVGMDITAKKDLYEIIVSLAEAGAGVLMISSDFEELELCSRVLIMRDGRITKELSGSESDQEPTHSLLLQRGGRPMTATHPKRRSTRRFPTSSARISPARPSSVGTAP